MNYDVDYFIKKFEAIPEELWIMCYAFIDGKCCALGHCGVRENNSSYTETDESSAISSLFGSRTMVWKINDGADYKYRQPTPKQRILAALYDIKRMQEPKQPEVIYKVIEVDRKVKELVKQERILN